MEKKTINNNKNKNKEMKNKILVFDIDETLIINEGNQTFRSTELLDALVAKGVKEIFVYSNGDNGHIVTQLSGIATKKVDIESPFTHIYGKCDFITAIDLAQQYIEANKDEFPTPHISILKDPKLIKGLTNCVLVDDLAPAFRAAGVKDVITPHDALGIIQNSNNWRIN